MRKRALLFIPVVACMLMAGGRRAGAQAIALRVVPGEAVPGATVYLEADSLPGTTVQGLNFTAAWREGTATGSPLPTFGDPPLLDPLAAGGLLDGALQPDGSYKVGLVKVPPARGAGALLRIPVAVPGGARPGAVYELILTYAKAVDGSASLNPVPASVTSGFLLVTLDGSGQDLQVGNAVGRPGAVADLPIRLGSVRDVGAVDLTLEIAGLAPAGAVSAGAAQSAALTGRSILGARQGADGLIHLSIADANGLTGPGDLAHLPLSISATAPPGTYALHAVDAQLSGLDGQPMDTTVGEGTLTVLSGSVGAPTRLAFRLPSISVPAGSVFPFQLLAYDASGALSVDPVARISIEGRSPDVTHVGFGVRPNAPGTFLLDAASGSASAQAAVEAFSPPSGQDLFTPVVYGRPGDQVMVPVYYAPTTFVADPIFDVTISGAAPGGTLPALAGTPVLYPTYFGGPGATYAAATGSPGSFRVWTRGLDPADGASLTWLVPVRLPAAGSGPAFARDYAVTLSPAASLDGSASPLKGGTGTLKVVSSPAPVQIAAPAGGSASNGPIHVQVTAPAPSAGILYGRAWIDRLTGGAVFFDGANPSADLDATSLAEGTHTVSVASTDHLGNTTSASVQVGIDRTPPIARIDSPTANQTVNGSLVVKGTADDAPGPISGFQSYQLILSGTPGGPALLTQPGTRPVQSGVLGTLNVSGLAGQAALYLRLEVRDRAGNRSVQEIPLSTLPGTRKGDVNGDGKVDMRDSTLLLQIVTGALKPTGVQKTAGDLNGDGVLDVKDVTLLLKLVISG